jgi:hypothetical protein
VFGTRSNIVQKCAGWGGGMKHKLNLYHVWQKQLFSCSSQRCALNSVRLLLSYHEISVIAHVIGIHSVQRSGIRPGPRQQQFNWNEKIISYRNLQVTSITIIKPHYDFVTYKWKHRLQAA